MKTIAVFFAFLHVFILSLTVPAWAQSQVDQAQPAKVYVAAYRTPKHVKYSQAVVFVEVTDGLMEFLHSKNVALVKGPMTEVHIPVKTLLKRARQAGAESLVYVTVDRPFSAWIKIKVECFDHSGKVLWKETSSDMWSMKGKGGTKKSLARMEAKLDKKLGGPGLQMSATEARPAAESAEAVKIAPRQPESPGRVWWVEAGAQTFVVQEHATEPLATFEAGENVKSRLLSPDGNLVAIESDGEVKAHVTMGGVLEHWPKAENHSSITLIKMPGYEVASHFDVPFRPHFLAFTADSARLAVVSLGQVSNNRDKQIAPEIVLLEVPSGKVLQEVKLASEPLKPWFIRGANRLIVPCRGVANRPEAPPELVIFDTRKGAVHKVPLPFAPVAWRGTGRGDWRYLEGDRGVMILNEAGETVGRSVEAGEKKLFFASAPQSKRYYLAGKTKGQGRLIVLEDGRVLKTIETIIPRALVVDDSHSRLILCGDHEGVILDSNTFAKRGSLPMPGSIFEARVGPAGKRLYVADRHFDISVIDLATRQQLAHISSGRGSTKFLQNVLIPSLMTFATVASFEMTGTPGIYPFGRLPAPIRAPVYCMAFSPNGDFFYVYNPRTNDITIVKIADNTIVRKVSLGPALPNKAQAREIAERFPWQSADGRYLVSCQLDKVVVIDTEKGEVASEKKYNGAKPRYEPSLGLIFLQEADGTEVLRLDSLGFVKDLKPTGKLVFKPKHEGLRARTRGTFKPPEDLIFKPKAQRFFLFSPAGVRIFDYELNPVGQVGGISNSGNIAVLP